jgi:hypothetical protein
MYAPLSNWRYDQGPHRIEGGPNYESYIVVSSGIRDLGADTGIVTPGAPNSGLWYNTTAWRAVPPAVSGYWTDYQNVDYAPSGALSSYEGYRPLGISTIAGVKVSTSYGPQFGLRTVGTSTYFNGVAPSSQNYTPYNTPDNNTPAQGRTGGGVTHGRYEGGILTNPTNDTSGSRASWQYNPPVYCRTFTETVRSTAPGLMSTALRFVYRGKAGTYVSNYASIYHQAPEGVRVMLRTYSPTVNSSNQKSV